VTADSSGNPLDFGQGVVNRDTSTSFQTSEQTFTLVNHAGYDISSLSMALQDSTNSHLEVVDHSSVIYPILDGQTVTLRARLKLTGQPGTSNISNVLLIKPMLPNGQEWPFSFPLIAQFVQAPSFTISTADIKAFTGLPAASPVISISNVNTVSLNGYTLQLLDPQFTFVESGTNTLVFSSFPASSTQTYTIQALFTASLPGNWISSMLEKYTFSPDWYPVIPMNSPSGMQWYVQPSITYPLDISFTIPASSTDTLTIPVLNNTSLTIPTTLNNVSISFSNTTHLTPPSSPVNIPVGNLFPVSFTLLGTGISSTTDAGIATLTLNSVFIGQINYAINYT